jgi:uncharacterized protein YjiK
MAHSPFQCIGNIDRVNLEGPSGIVYHSERRTLFELTGDGDILEAYTLPGDNQEGIAGDENGFLYIAQDSGGIIKVQWDRAW